MKILRNYKVIETKNTKTIDGQKMYTSLSLDGWNLSVNENSLCNKGTYLHVIFHKICFTR